MAPLPPQQTWRPLCSCDYLLDWPTPLPGTGLKANRAHCHPSRSPEPRRPRRQGGPCSATDVAVEGIQAHRGQGTMSSLLGLPPLLLKVGHWVHGKLRKHLKDREKGSNSLNFSLDLALREGRDRNPRVQSPCSISWAHSGSRARGMDNTARGKPTPSGAEHNQCPTVGGRGFPTLPFHSQDGSTSGKGRGNEGREETRTARQKLP